MLKLNAFKTILFMLLVPGTMLVLLPCYLLGTDGVLFSFGVFHWLALPFWAGGAAIMIWCAWELTVRGGGTPLPTDPPKELVVNGLYRTIRNPIYMGVVLFLLGTMLWHPSQAILLMPVLVAVSSHLFVIFYEEPHLRRTFGPAYDEYCKAVPRWIPKLRKLK